MDLSYMNLVLIIGHWFYEQIEKLQAVLSEEAVESCSYITWK